MFDCGTIRLCWNFTTCFNNFTHFRAARLILENSKIYSIFGTPPPLVPMGASRLWFTKHVWWICTLFRWQRDILTVTNAYSVGPTRLAANQATLPSRHTSDLGRQPVCQAQFYNGSAPNLPHIMASCLLKDLHEKLATTRNLPAELVTYSTQSVVATASL